MKHRCAFAGNKTLRRGWSHYILTNRVSGTARKERAGRRSL